MPCVGEQLQRAREAQDLSLDEIAGSTRIGRAYLEALEEGRYEALPGRAFGKFYIRAYADKLGFDPDPLLRDYEDELRGWQQPDDTREEPEPGRRRVGNAIAAWREGLIAEREKELAAEAEEPAGGDAGARSGADTGSPDEADIDRDAMLETRDEEAVADDAALVEAAAEVETAVDETDAAAALDDDAGDGVTACLDDAIVAIAEEVPLETETVAEVESEAPDMDDRAAVEPAEEIPVAGDDAPAGAAADELPVPATTPAAVDGERGRPLPSGLAATIRAPGWLLGLAAAILLAILLLIGSGLTSSNGGDLIVDASTPRIDIETAAPVEDDAGAALSEPETAHPAAPVETPAEIARSAAASEPVEALAPSTLTVTEHGVGRRVVGHRLRDAGTTFTEGNVVAFQTRVTGGRAGEIVRHVWLLDGRVQQSIALRLGSSSFRTHSTKTLWGTGAWVVEARDSAGRVLVRDEFTCVAR